MQQAQDFLDESLALAALLEPLGEADFARETLFKGWTISDVLGHLHLFNHAAALTAESGEAFQDFVAPIVKGLAAGKTMVTLQQGWLDGLGGLAGRALLDAWREGAEACAAAYAKIDPKARLKWAGPEMSARSCITARQMETWAHGHEVFDVLGAARAEADRIRNIAHLGVTTYRWSFSIREEKAPWPPPYLRLTAPSGEEWTWHEPRDDKRIEGTAVAFCQVVTQVRNVADTTLKATGAAATRWMAIAQCFAGPPEDPPAPGARHKAAIGKS